MSKHEAEHAERRAGYHRHTVEYVFEEGPWEGWSELLEWLRADGVSDPQLDPDALRGLRQDAEQAVEVGAPFPRDAEELWTVLRENHVD
jgi:hypothetical protein